MVLSRVVYEIAGGEGLLPPPKNPTHVLGLRPFSLAPNKNPGYALGSGLETLYVE